MGKMFAAWLQAGRCLLSGGHQWEPWEAKVVCHIVWQVERQHCPRCERLRPHRELMVMPEEKAA